jgi:hypothetical protein
VSTAENKQRCPACAELGRDTAADNLTVFPSGKFHCIAAGKDKQHNARIIELMPSLGKDNGNVADTLSGRATSHPRAMKTPVKRLDLLSRIKADFPACLYDLWESSPIRCDEDLDDAHEFLKLFPADAVMWIAPDIYHTGKPEHAKFFRTRSQWEAGTFTAPGMRIAPSSFKPGSYSRSAENVAEHLFTVIESDAIGDGKLYADKDQFCSLIRWLREACGWHLSAVVDSGRRSLHAWFTHPGFADMTQLAEHAAGLGLDSKFSEPSQPWRLPGMKREKSDTRQQLLYLDLKDSI